MRDIIRNIFFDDEVTYRTYKGSDKVFRQNISNFILDLGPGSEVEVDMESQMITKVYKAVNPKKYYCNHCGKRFLSSVKCYEHSIKCNELGYLRHPEGEDIDGVYKRRRRLDKNNG